MKMLSIGVLGTSLKENEYRIPIHPDHINQIDKETRKNLYFEKEYAEKFGVEIESFHDIGGTLEREELFKQCDIILVPKPVLSDFKSMKNDGILCGWAHLVQQEELTQVCIDSHLSVITWESMHEWKDNGKFIRHLFNKNNEVAGYAAVLDSCRLLGIDGNYGPVRSASIIGFGSVARGAVRCLQGIGFKDITVYTFDDPNLVLNKIANVNHQQMKLDSDGKPLVIEKNGNTRPFINDLSSSDIIVNGILQDTDTPVMFVNENEIEQLKKNSLIVDVSCDEDMGFYGAKPTSFKEPMFKIKQVNYYAVDHTPSYLWNSVSWEISKAIISFLKDLMNGVEKWKENKILNLALEIEQGVIANSKITTFQNRSAKYPHDIKK